ncbi:suppressor protein SRP40-like [Solanum dulcamara]|uniref:suppressor protein SRP40-like n=1 Tax=Solanum dulcamara TaxID=45834 RepID=UPI002485D968|nr:suppressor protein SRP40-like [Solanum dulcamara]
MALTPPVALRRPPDLVQEERLSPRNKTQLESTPNSIRSSSYIDYNTATPVEISKEQLAWAQKIISWSQNKSNGETQGKDAESDSKQLYTQQISNDFTLPIGKSGDTQGDSDTESGSSDKEFSNSDENFLNLKRFDTGTQNVEDSASVSTGAGNASQERILKQSNVNSKETTRSNIQINPSKSVSIPIEHKSKEVTHSVQQEVKNNKENEGENELNPIAIETDTQDNIGKTDACNNSTKINHNNSASNKTQLPHDLTKLTSNFVKHNPQYKPNMQNSNDKPPTKPKQLPQL